METGTIVRPVSQPVPELCGEGTGRLLFLFGDAASITADGVDKIWGELLSDKFPRFGFRLFVEHTPASVLGQIFSIGFTISRRSFNRTLTGSLLPWLILRPLSLSVG